MRYETRKFVLKTSYWPKRRHEALTGLRSDQFENGYPYMLTRTKTNILNVHKDDALHDILKCDVNGHILEHEMSDEHLCSHIHKITMTWDDKDYVPGMKGSEDFFFFLNITDV
jgi:hypothetical protein